MESLTGALDFLSWPTEIVNQLRAVLADLNVPLPAVLAQLLAAVVLGAIGWYFLADARKPERTLGRLAARSMLAATVIGILSIVVAWIDNLVAPRSHEIVGRVVPSPIAGLQVYLLDYRDEAVGTEIQTDDSGAFVVAYTPAFADPPKALLVSSARCDERRQSLSRSHLLGAELTIQLTCRDGDD